MIEDKIVKLIDESQSQVERTLLRLLMSMWAHQAYLDEYRYRDIVQKVCSGKGLKHEKFDEIREHFMEDAKLYRNDGSLL